MRIRAYRNLNAKGGVTEWSVIPLDSVPKELKGKVCAYASALDLQNVVFKASSRGAQVIREKGVRSVVAYVQGELVAASFTRIRLFPELQELPDAHALPDGEPVRFRVFEGFDYFTLSDDTRIDHSHRVSLTDEGRCFAYPDEEFQLCCA